MMMNPASGTSLRGQQSNNQSTTTHQPVASAVDQGALAIGGGGEDGCTEDLLAIEKIVISCPQCRHEFKLIDGLVLDEQAVQQQQQQLLQLQTPQQQPQEQQPQEQQQQLEQGTSNASRLSPMTRSDTCSSATTTRLTMGGTATATAATQQSAPRTGGGGGGGGFGFCGDAPEPAQVCQTFQIVNRTIDQLERLICDPYDRRIRKIWNMSQCDIEIRSELPSRKFGAARNFCTLRAISGCRIDKCRGLLQLQMGWVLLPKP